MTAATAFPPDGKWAAIRAWFDERLRPDGQLTDEERAIWFTEYKDTLDYLLARLASEGYDVPQVRSLFGGSSLAERAEVRESFNEATDPIRLLVATDVASEGLNLQTSCRYVVHYEVPWNPMRLEQRNGRVDRHGQARDVTAFHFTSDEDEDVKFLDYVVNKVDKVRTDLGSVGEVIDRGLEERFCRRAADRRGVGSASRARARALLPNEPTCQNREDPIDERAGDGAAAVLDATARSLRIDPDRLERLFTIAAKLDQGEVRPTGDGAVKLHKSPPSWQRTVDASLRIDKPGARGAMPRLVFASDALMQTTAAGRQVYRDRPDTRLMRLAHPVMRRATATLRRRLWEERPDLRRFTIATHDQVDAPTLLVPNLLAIVNELREPVHAELIELALRLGNDNPAVVEAPQGDPRPLADADVNEWRIWLEEHWDDLADELEGARAQSEAELREDAEILLPALLKDERGYQDKLFRNRLKELDDERGERGRTRLRRQIEKLEEKTRQLTFDPELRHEREEELRQLKEQLEGEEYRRVEERRARLRARIEREREHLLDEVLPRRFRLARCALTPVAVALLVPEGSDAVSVVQHEWWGELRHGGMLVAPQFLDELIPELAELDEHGYDRLRSAWLRLDAALYGGVDIEEARRSFAGELLEGFLALHGWQKASSVAAEFKATSIMGEALRPGWVLPDPEGDGALLAVWFDGSDSVGRGRGVRAQAKLVELLRATGVPLGLLTNGRQFRLVHAGPDYDAWAEWDAQTWFDESEGRETLRGLAALLQGESGGALDRLRALIRTIHDSRNRQGDLAQVLGEQVRQGIELLVREVDHKLAADSDLNAALWTDPGSGHRLSEDEALAAIYQAATRVVMRLVLVLYAEASDLLPANVEAYHDSYGVGSLYDTLFRADREGRDALAEATAAWPRMLSLFRLIYFGSGHAELPVREYGGQLFRPGDRMATEPVLRALAALEATRPTDAIVYRLLRLLKVGKVKVRAGRARAGSPVPSTSPICAPSTSASSTRVCSTTSCAARTARPDRPPERRPPARAAALAPAELTAAELKELLKTFRKDAASAAGTDDAERGTRPTTRPLRPTTRPTPSRRRPKTRLTADEEPTADEEDEQTEDDARDPRAGLGAWSRRGSGHGAPPSRSAPRLAASSRVAPQRPTSSSPASSPRAGSTSSPPADCARAQDPSTLGRRSRSRLPSARWNRAATSATVTVSSRARPR